MRLASHQSIRRRVAALVAAGPVHTDHVVALLVAEGTSLGDDPDDVLFDALEHDDFDITEQGMWVHLPAVTADQRWWLEVPAEATNTIVADAHLHVLDRSGGRSYPLVSAAGVPDDEIDVMPVDGRLEITGPAGWLDAFAGGAAELTVTDGAIALAGTGDRPAATAQMAAAVRSMFDALVADREAAVYDATTVVLDSLLVDPAAFRTGVIPPAEVLIASAGLELHGNDVGIPGTDWAAVDAAQLRRSIASVYELDDAGVDDVLALLDAADAILAGHVPDDGSSATRLGRPEIGEAFLAEGDRRGIAIDEWLTIARAIHAPVAGEPGSSGAAYVLAVALEANDLVDEAIALLERTVEIEAHPLVSFELALYRADQGDAPAAARLLQRSGATPDDESPEGDLLREIEPFVVRPKATADRNDPCPCGSGRKYKACHAGAERHPLEQRAGWLHQRATRWTVTHDPGLVSSVALIVNDVADGDHQLLEQLLDSTLASDIAMHEGGAFDDFLTQRGHLLPDDEALMAAQWQLADRGVFEVVDVRRDSVGLRDLRTGDVLDVGGLGSTELVQVGRRVIARPLPVGDQWRSFFGLVPLGDRFVDAAIEVFDDPSADRVAELIGRAFAPPQLANSDGEPLRFHELQWKVDPALDVPAALTDAGFHSSGPRWTLTDHDDTIVATLTLDGDLLTGEANSDHRAQVLLGIVGDALPAAELVDDDARDLWELESDDDEPPTGEIDFDGPDMRAALERFTIGYEQRWLDEQVPALGGLTPREAADDPIGRRDLERLLSSMPTDAEPGEMSATRLRAALGL